VRGAISLLTIGDRLVFLYRLVKFYAKVAAIRGITKQNRRKIKQTILTDLGSALTKSIPKLPDYLIQNSTFPDDIKISKKIMVILVPEGNHISGGLLSLFSIASNMRRVRKTHGYDVIAMTLPSKDGQTFYRNKFFRSDESAYRFAQILECRSATDVYIHIPEYAVRSFCALLSTEERQYLQGIENLHINILNQNVTLMPDKTCVDTLRILSNNISQSVAHHAYFSQKIADTYGLPTLLLTAYTDLSAYPPVDIAEKEKLIIYSPDNAKFKQRCLDTISRNCPDFELKEIRGISFDHYMDLATRCMFSITFGEGFDGYLAQPIHQGGIGFAVYNQEFFPTRDFLRYENIFESDDHMVNDICDRIRALSSDEGRYRHLNSQLMEEYRKLYSHADYIRQLQTLALKQFEYLPARQN
jgi:hypothetical protein